MTAAGYVRGTNEPGKRWVKPSERDTQISDKVWCASTHNAIIKRLMQQVGMPNSTSLYLAFKQFAVELHALAECARRGIDPDELCADGGVTAEMVVAKEIDAGCGQAVITPWQTPAPCGGRIGSTWLALDPLRNQIMRLMREEFDPTPPNWEGREWNDNAEDTADKILAAVRIAMRGETVRKEFI